MLVAAGGRSRCNPLEGSGWFLGPDRESQRNPAARATLFGPFSCVADVLCASAGSVGNDEMSLTERVIGKTGLRAGRRGEKRIEGEERGRRENIAKAGWLVGW